MKASLVRELNRRRAQRRRDWRERLAERPDGDLRVAEIERWEAQIRQAQADAAMHGAPTPGGGLAEALGLAVPLWIWHYRRAWPEVRADRARHCAKVVVAHGDDLLYHTPSATGPVFNRLAEGIALLAFQPGGVRLFGQHWHATPEDGEPPTILERLALPAQPAANYFAWRPKPEDSPQ